MAGPPLPSRDTFIANSLDSIAACTICHEPFSATHIPTRIRACNHIFGRDCLREWIDSTQARSNSCPNCRSVLFTNTAPFMPTPPITSPRIEVLPGTRPEGRLVVDDEFDSYLEDITSYQHAHCFVLRLRTKAQVLQQHAMEDGRRVYDSDVEDIVNAALYSIVHRYWRDFNTRLLTTARSMAVLKRVLVDMLNFDEHVGEVGDGDRQAAWVETVGETVGWDLDYLPTD